MTVREAAEKYAEGFYLRPDGDRRDWDKYRDDQIEALSATFRLLYDAGGEILGIQHIYTTRLELTVQLELKLPSEGALDLLEQFEDGGDIPGKPHAVHQWAWDMMWDLIDDSCNEVHTFSLMEGSEWSCKLLISEVY